MKKTLKNTLILTLLLTTLILGVAGSTTFGSSTGNPQPVLQEINIHDVTNLNNQEDGENLEDTITPSSTEEKRLEARQENETRKYRYDFVINNEGDQDWNIEGQDILKHDNISTSWSIELTDGNEDIWYQIEGGTKRRGGTIDTDKLEWNTSQQGTLQPGEQLNASYIFETTQTKTELTQNQYFKAETIIDGENNTGSEDTHETEILKIGDLNLTIEEPPDETRVQSNKTFVINGTLSCENGECGNITTTPRYNETSSTMTTIPETTGEKPFYTNKSNQRECNQLTNSCTVQWDVNATGELDTENELDLLSESTFPEIENQNSTKKTVSTEYFLIVRDNRENTTFGAVDVNSSKNPAHGNLEEPPHQITVDSYSQPVDELYLKSTSLTSYYIDGYEIKPQNISYWFENDTSQRKSMNSSLEVIKTDIQPGTTIDLFYWLHVPPGKVQDYYNGTKTFAAYSEP